MTREQIEGLIKVLSGPDLYTIAHIRAIAPSAAAALRAQQERIDALEAEREQMAHQWNAVQDLALLPALPPGWVEPTAEMIDAGAQRLASFEDDSVWPDSWDAGQVAQMRVLAERVIRSAMLAARPALSTESGWDDAAVERVLTVFSRKMGFHEPSALNREARYEQNDAMRAALAALAHPANGD